jgi:hypothetical protein
VRAVPFLIIAAVILGPLLVVGVIISGAALRLWGPRHFVRRVAVLASALACAEFPTCAAIIYTVRPETIGSSQECVGR